MLRRQMISIIIPVYNEEAALPVTLDMLFRQPGEFEVIVVDGGSSDATPDIMGGYPRARLLNAPKGRASQMNAGAQEANGEWLLFLHADTLLPGNALLRLNRLEADSDCQAGGFQHRFSGEDWRLRLVSLLDNYRCKRTRIIFGDQAMFVRRGLFEKLGGFPQQPILEDVAFCEKLVKVTTPIIMDEHIITNPRKFIKNGVWRSLGQCATILARLQLGLPVSASHRFFQDVR